MTRKEKLHAELLNWKPEIAFAEDGSKSIIMEVDPFNYHITWSVKYYDEGYFYKEFGEDFNAACDFFIGEDDDESDIS